MSSIFNNIIISTLIKVNNQIVECLFLNDNFDWIGNYWIVSVTTGQARRIDSYWNAYRESRKPSFCNRWVENVKFVLFSFLFVTKVYSLPMSHAEGSRSLLAADTHLDLYSDRRSFARCRGHNSRWIRTVSSLIFFVFTILHS